MTFQVTAEACGGDLDHIRVRRPTGLHRRREPTLQAGQPETRQGCWDAAPPPASQRQLPRPAPRQRGRPVSIKLQQTPRELCCASASCTQLGAQGPARLLRPGESRGAGAACWEGPPQQSVRPQGRQVLEAALMKCVTAQGRRPGSPLGHSSYEALR